MATLGVYPARSRGDRPEPYRPRLEDAELREALQRSKMVIIHGPPGVGKSRAASESARSVLANIPAILPVNADALRFLVEDSLKLRLPESRVCLWLDGLDRFLEALNSRALQSLSGLAPDVKIVATIRSDQWDELLHGTGQHSEAARSIAAWAEMVELGPLDPEAEETETPPGSEPDRRPVRRSAPPWRDGWLIALGAGLTATLLVAVIAGSKGELLQPLPIHEQMEREKAAALQGDRAGPRHVVIDARVRLHPAEADSWLLVVQDRPSHDEFHEGAVLGIGPPPRSDELRIYDVRDGRLRLALHFRPKGIGRKASEWRELSEGASLAADYDQDG